MLFSTSPFYTSATPIAHHRHTAALQAGCIQAFQQFQQRTQQRDQQLADEMNRLSSLVETVEDCEMSDKANLCSEMLLIHSLSAELVSDFSTAVTLEKGIPMMDTDNFLIVAEFSEQNKLIPFTEKFIDSGHQPHNNKAFSLEQTEFIQLPNDVRSETELEYGRLILMLESYYETDFVSSICPSLKPSRFNQLVQYQPTNSKSCLTQVYLSACLGMEIQTYLPNEKLIPTRFNQLIVYRPRMRKFKQSHPIAMQSMFHDLDSVNLSLLIILGLF